MQEPTATDTERPTSTPSTPSTPSGSILDGARFILIARRIDPAVLLDALGPFGEAGLRHVEVTLDTPDACGIIDTIRQRFPHLVVGAGTVTSADDIERAVAAGSQFAVSPHGDRALAAAAAAHGLPYVPAAYTPTEAVTAWGWGVALVKLFPIAALGAVFLRQVRGPFPDIPLIATGGVTVANALEYRQAGATAVGMGSDLLGRWRTGDDREHGAVIHQLADLLVALEQDDR